MQQYSNSLSLGFDLTGSSLAEVVQTLRQAFSDTGHAPIAKWKAPLGSPKRTDISSFEPALQALHPPRFADEAQATTAGFDLADGTLLGVGVSRAKPDVWGVGIYSYSDATASSDQPEFSPQGFVDALYRAAALCRHLLQAGVLVSARLLRQGSTGLPNLPVVGDATHILVCTSAEIEVAYNDPAVVWEQGGWETHEQYGDKHLLLRGMEAADEAAFLSATLDGHFAMARAAKPRLTTYYPLGTLSEQARRQLKIQEHALNFAGYLPDEQLAEYSCYIEPDAHIQPWEIYALADIVQRGRLSDDTPIKTARVVFFSRDMAQREKRPLLDVGARVFYINPKGDPELLEVTK